MHSNIRYARVLVLAATLLLAGASDFWCTDDNNSNNSKSSGGKSDIQVKVGDEKKIAENSGGFNGNLSNDDKFGSAVTDLGDLEADGVTDLAVGAPFDDDDGNNKGAVWILFMDDDGRVDQHQKISSEAGSFGGNLKGDDEFGSAVAGIGDLNVDGVFDLAVGAPGNDNGGTDRGGLWILFLDAEGKVRGHQEIADSEGGFDGNLDDEDKFGSAVAAIGDVNGDGVMDLAVGAPNSDDGFNNAGAVWILFMKVDGKVASQQKISNDAGGLGDKLAGDDQFGSAVAGIGDLDNDGIPDLAVGAPGAGPDRGVIWILFLDVEGKVREQQKITDGTGGFNGTLDDNDRFGSAIAAVGDQDGDGITDLAVGAPNDDDNFDNAGAIWVLMMETDGRVADWQKVSDDSGGFGGNLDADDHFGAAVAGIGNLDNKGLADIAVGAPGDDREGENKGAVWILFMERKN
jgi:hypothetical protein